MYVVEWFGVLYGPFHSEQAAALFTPPMQTANAMARGTVRRLEGAQSTHFSDQQRFR